MRWHEVTRRAARRIRAVAAPAGGVELQIVRTVPEHIYKAVPRGDFGILETYLRALRAPSGSSISRTSSSGHPRSRRARRQARQPAVARLPDLRRAARHAEQRRGQHARHARRADRGRRRRGPRRRGALYARSGVRADPIYVHAKVGIIDDHWLTIGSANLNEHSLFNDTEMNIVSHDPTLARRTRLRLWAEHLERPLERSGAIRSR